MTGREIAKLLRKAKGPIMAPMLTPQDSPFILVSKKSLIEWATDGADLELGMRVESDAQGTYITTGE